MKLRVTHDKLGNITAIVASPNPPEGACSVSRAGQFVTEIEVPEIAADLSSTQMFERLSDLMQTYRVALKDASPHLTRKLPKRAKPTSRARSR
jgi:hypothetical protein